MTRRDYLLKHVDIKKIGLEIGPLHAPIVTKEEGNIYYLDHVSRAGLIKKYAENNIVAEKIVEVDYILKNNSLRQSVNGRKFDYVIASHVIEHIPDTVRWLQDIAFVLKPKGVVSLAIPDKRFTFDINRNVSRPADIIGAYLDNLHRPYSSLVYDHYIESRKIDFNKVWANPEEDLSKKPPVHSLELSYKKGVDNINPRKFVDVHCNVYTPASFIKIIEVLIRLGLLDFTLLYIHETNANDLEFHVTLKKSSISKIKKLSSLPKIKQPLTEYQLFTQNLQLKKQNSELAAIIAHMENSRSWTVTKPLRQVLKLTNKLKRR